MNLNTWLMLVFGLAMTAVGIYMVRKCFLEMGNLQHPMFAGVVFFLGVLMGLLSFLTGIFMMQEGLIALGKMFTQWLVQLNGG